MHSRTFLMIIAAVMLSGATAFAEHPEHPAAKPSADDQFKGLEKMCEASAAARTARHAEKSLYERLGKEKGINLLTKEIVRLHLQDDPIKHMFEGLDNDQVAKHVADFMISGLGGPQVYKDRPSLTESHVRLKLTNAEFMAAGGDVMQAMKNLKYGQNEIDEMVCTLVALQPQVVLK